MRARDIRALQREHNKERWRELYAPANDDAAEPDPEGDEAWLVSDIEMIGRKFGRLQVLSRAERRDAEGKRRYWECACSCGAQKVVHGGDLKSGKTQSCGCLNRELASQRATLRNQSHGRREAPEYGPWAAMIARCTNQRDKRFDRYGGRGIKVCERWMSIDAFLEDMGPRPSPKHSLDRKDNDGNYEPGNVRWATAVEQARNTSRNRLLTVDGVTRCLGEWCASFGIHQETVRCRLARGWPADLALATPAGRGKNQHTARADMAWREAIAEANSGTQELNRRDE